MFIAGLAKEKGLAVPSVPGKDIAVRAKSCQVPLSLPFPIQLSPSLVPFPIQVSHPSLWFPFL